MIAESTIDSGEWRWVFISSALLLILISVPFMWAYGVGAPEARFMGVLVNPIDGASYQAKMAQGYEGHWLFQLPYTPEQHQGVFLFTAYIALGHLARLLNVSPILVFHAMRLVGGALMAVALYRFVADWTDNVVQRRISWGLAMIGAGFGWLALLFGHVTPDLLILPEAFPLQAAYANPHFPWAIAIALTIAHVLARKALVETDLPDLNVETVATAFGAVLLVSMSPFVLVPIGVGYLALLLWIVRRRGMLPLHALAWGAVVLIFSLPLVAYNGWAISAANPVFHAWMQQNRTPSPPLWDYLIAFAPLLVLAAVGIWGSRRKLQGGDVFLLAWLVSAAVMLYVPLGLQRRFAMGLIAPLAVYAGRGLWRVILSGVWGARSVVTVLLVFTTFIPTTVLAIVMPMVGALQLMEEGGGSYFLYMNEVEALDWLEQHAAPQKALVLASPEISLFLPTRGLRVVYGHPFETLNAEVRRQAVLDFFSGRDCSVVSREGVDYVLIGPREQTLAAGGVMCPLSVPVFVSSDGKVAVYAVSGG